MYVLNKPVGRYGVDAQRLRALVEAKLERPQDGADVLLIDEVGKMELLCPAFVEAVPRLLDEAPSPWSPRSP